MLNRLFSIFNFNKILFPDYFNINSKIEKMPPPDEFYLIDNDTDFLIDNDTDYLLELV